MPLKNGKRLSLALVLLFSACRESVPPPLEICVGDGFGGADCIESDKTQKYRSPSELQNYWMTNQTDEAAFASWCYDGDPAAAKTVMQQIQTEAQR